MINYDNILKTLLELVSVKSITGTTNESLAADKLYEMSQLKKATIVIGFAPPFYPNKNLTEDVKGIKLLSCINNCISYAKNSYNEDIKIENYFKGICDLSYTGINKELEIDSVFNNMPGAFINYALPVEKLRKLDIPSLVFGGYGKDFHKNTERLNRKYSLEVVPKLYLKLIYDIFRME